MLILRRLLVFTVTQFYIAVFFSLLLNYFIWDKQLQVKLNFVPNYSESFLEIIFILVLCFLIFVYEIYKKESNLFYNLAGTWITYSSIRYLIFDFKENFLIKNLLFTIYI